MKFSDSARFWMHMPIGLLFAWGILLNPPLGIAGTFLLCLYQINEDWRIKDGAWKDFSGYISGFALVVIYMALVKAEIIVEIVRIP